MGGCVGGVKAWELDESKMTGNRNTIFASITRYYICLRVCCIKRKWTNHKWIKTLFNTSLRLQQRVLALLGRFSHWDTDLTAEESGFWFFAGLRDLYFLRNVCYDSEAHPESNPITVLDRPWGFHEVEAPRFQDNRHMVRFVSPTHR